MRRPSSIDHASVARSRTLVVRDTYAVVVSDDPAPAAATTPTRPPVDDDPGRPPRRPQIDLVAALEKATWKDYVCIGGIVAAVVVSLLSYPMSAFLLRHVKVHLVATASLSALMTAGAAVFNHTESLAVVLVLAVVGLCKFDPFYFWAGRRYGDDVAGFLEQQGGIRPRTVARAERWVGRFGPPILTAAYFLPIPSNLVMVLLGASGVSWTAFAIADLLGVVGWIAIFVAVGHHFHTEVDHVAHVVNHYTLLIGLGLFALVFLVAFLRGWRAQARSQA